MKAECVVSKDNLQMIIARVLAAVDKRATMPILYHLRVSVRKNQTIAVAATDLELYASAECTAEVPGEWFGFCVPAELLKNAISGVSGNITLAHDSDDQKLTLSGDGYNIELATLTTDEYPQPTRITSPIAGFNTSPGFMCRTLAAVSHAMSADQTKSNLCGITVQVDDNGTLTAAATDGHRLSIAAQTLDADGAPCGGAPGFTLPAKAVRVLAGKESGYQISLGENNVALQALNFDLTAQLLAGDYPDYRRIIPADRAGDITVDAEALIDAINVVAVVDEKDKVVRLEPPTDAMGEKMIVTAVGASGVARAYVPCLFNYDKPFSLSARYLLQALKSLGSGEVFITCGDKTPIVIIPVDHGPWTERIELIAQVGRKG